ncbi:MAG: hypothetical protein IKG11_09130 [Atopobiaceae bacterium]|nr:hypothetical protein [Atopobiaceae bacterium]
MQNERERRGLMDHEKEARAIHRSGYNCSNSVYQAFSDIDHAGGNPPAPRSIAGKCGALITAQKVLRDLGIDREEELEQAFASELGYVLCRDLKRNRVDCNDCVGVAARLVDEYAAQEAQT